MTTKIIAHTTRTVRRKPADRWDWDRMEVDAQLYHIEGNSSPHFSVTAATTIKGREDSGGCLHDLIAEHCPDLAPVIKVHLSDDHGVPMHAVANGVYWAGLSSRYMPDVKSSYGQYVIETDERGRTWAPEVFARHLRITDTEARTLRADMARTPVGPYTFKGWAEHVLDGLIHTVLAARWQADADAAMAVLNAEVPT